MKTKHDPNRAGCASVLYSTSCDCNPILKVTHTPTPWIYKKEEGLILNSNGECIVSELRIDSAPKALQQQANAVFIVRAGNNHETLLREVKNYRAKVGRDYENTLISYLDELIAQAEGGQ